MSNYDTTKILSEEHDAAPVVQSSVSVLSNSEVLSEESFSPNLPVTETLGERGSSNETFELLKTEPLF